MPWKVILLTETGRARLALRRYAADLKAPCSAGYYHEALTVIGSAPITIDAEGNWDVDMPQPPPTDPRWPARCACGYEFTEADNRQLLPKLLYTRQDTGAELTQEEAEPGMMWRTWWFEDFWRGPDGHCYTMCLPGNGEWTIDGPSSNGQGWQRTGEPPNITVRPSILSHGSATRKEYHGWVTDGVLSDDLEGRTY